MLCQRGLRGVGGGLGTRGMAKGLLGGVGMDWGGGWQYLEEGNILR